MIPSSTRRRSLALGALGIVGSGCATGGGSFPSNASARPATDAPVRFEADARRGTLGRAAGTDICQSPLTDLRTGARLRLYRSEPGRGDYEVSAGQYGAVAGEVLRVDCRTLQPIGLVRR